MKQANFTFLFLTFLVAGTLLSSCKSKKVAMDSGEKALDEELAAILDSSEYYSLKPENVSFKSSAKIERGEKTNRITLYVRIKPDSVVWVSARAMGMEISRLLASRDSVFIVNKAQKEYYRGGYEGLNKKTGVSFSFAELQGVFLANPLWPENKSVLEILNKEDNYLVGNTNPAEEVNNNKLVVNTMVNPKNYRITKLMINDVNKNRSATVEYSNFELHEEEYIIPTQAKIFLRSAQPASVELNYSKIKFNSSGLIYPFKFYDQYDPIP